MNNYTSADEDCYAEFSVIWKDEHDALSTKKIINDNVPIENVHNQSNDVIYEISNEHENEFVIDSRSDVNYSASTTCVCNSKGIGTSELTTSQKRFVDCVRNNLNELNVNGKNISIIILDGAPGCGKSAVVTYVMSKMRKHFKYVRFAAEKLLNLETLYKDLCPLHVKKHVGMNCEKSMGSDALLTSVICMCSIAKILYDVVSLINLSTKHGKMRRCPRTDVEKLSCCDTYRDEIETIINTYIQRFKNPVTRGINLYIIDEYAMIPKEKLYFIIAFLSRRFPNSKSMFILSGDVDQVDPIGHDNNDIIDETQYKEDYFQVGRSNDIINVCKSIVHTTDPNESLSIIDKIILNEPVRCEGDNVMKTFVECYKKSETLQSKSALLNNFIYNNFVGFNNSEIELNSNSVIDYLNMKTYFININAKVIVRSNNEMIRLNQLVFDLFKQRFPSLTVSANNQNFIIGMKYVLTKTVDFKHKTLCNRMVVVLRDVLYSDKEPNKIVKLLVCKHDDPTTLYTIGPILNSNRQLSFPIQLELIENSFQIQGMTISRNMWLDFKNCCNQHRYVMITRARNLRQIKSIINI